MNEPNPEPDEHLSDALDDRSRAKTATVAPRTQQGTRGRSPLLAALALGAAVLVGVVAASQLSTSNATGVETAANPTSVAGDTTSMPSGTNDVPTGSAEGSHTASTVTGNGGEGADGANGRADGERGAGARLRVDTAAVLADTEDPFLNVRSAAAADADLVAKLPPTYRGLAATAAEEISDEGATWIEVELIHPVHLLGPDPGASNPTGWVNAAYTAALDGIGVGLDEVPACAPGPGAPEGAVVDRAGFVYGLESKMVTDDCLRIVLTVGDGTAPIFWDSVPADTAPSSVGREISSVSSGLDGFVFNLGPLTSAWPAATSTSDHVYLVRNPDQGLGLVVTLPVGAGFDSRDSLTYLPEIGVIVIDLRVGGEPPLNDELIALTRPPLVGPGSVAVVGIARPFEANLGVSVVDDAGRSVEAVFSGSLSLGTRRSDAYAVQTTDWAEAWGFFAVGVEQLEPGRYTMLLDARGGADEPTLMRVPFTIGDPGPSDLRLATEAQQEVVRALTLFAKGVDSAFDAVPFANEVRLGLGPVERKSLAKNALADRRSWVIDVDGFADFSGPFNLLEPLVEQRPRITQGRIQHCAGPPREWPTEWSSLTQVNVEPVGIDSCIGWYGLSLFMNDEGEVEAVVLDLFGP